jgi:hypothetical protein
VIECNDLLYIVYQLIYSAIIDTQYKAVITGNFAAKGADSLVIMIRLNRAIDVRNKSGLLDLSIDPKKESCMALLFLRFIRFIGATALVTDLTFTLELLTQHLSLFLELTAAGGTAFAFVIAPFFAWGLPALKHSGHDIWLGIN